MAYANGEGSHSGRSLIPADDGLQELHMSVRQTEKSDISWPMLQAFATKAFPEAATKAARAVFPLHANLDEKIKEKFGRGVQGVTEKNLSEPANVFK